MAGTDAAHWEGAALARRRHADTRRTLRADLEAKAKAKGMLSEDGSPMPGAATMAAMGEMAQQPSAGQAREWEMENAQRYKTGALNDAELGMANLKQAMGDPQMISSVMNMMKDPNTSAPREQSRTEPQPPRPPPMPPT